MEKRRLTGRLLFLMLIAGIALMLYPSLSEYWNSFHSSKAISNYNQKLEKLDEETRQKIFADVHAYNEGLLQRANPFTLTKEQEAAYDNLLNLGGDGAMGYLEIPTISCKIPIYHTTEEAVLQKAVGHMPWTSLPGGGTSTHCALSGHRGLPTARLFSELDQVEEGDEFYLYIMKETLKYQVDQILIVEPKESGALLITPGEDYCTLITCTPYGVNTHRLLVRGKRVEETTEGKANVSSEAARVEPLLVAGAMMVLAIIVMLVLAFVPEVSFRRLKGLEMK